MGICKFCGPEVVNAHAHHNRPNGDFPDFRISTAISRISTEISGFCERFQISREILGEVSVSGGPLNFIRASMRRN